MTTRVQIRSTSLKRCEFRKTVTPSDAQLGDEVADLAAPDRVHAVGRLVEEDDARAAHERLRQTEALHHALRVRAHAAVRGVGERDALEQLGRARRTVGFRDAVHLGHQAQRLAAGQERREAVALGQEARRDARRGVLHVHAQDLGAAGRGVRQPEQQLHERRLAGSVGAEQAEGLAGLDGERERLQRDDGAPARVGLGERLGVDGCGHGRAAGERAATAPSPSCCAHGAELHISFKFVCTRGDIWE